jgi:Fe-S cluster assembly scaffold protein SufB
VDEPSIADAKAILKGIRKQFEQFHSVEISDEAIDSAVDYSVRYQTDKKLPDKAIDVLDEVGARVHLKNINVPLDIVDLEKQIEEVKNEKNRVVKSQRFEEAASLRDTEKKLGEALEKAKLNWVQVEVGSIFTWKYPSCLLVGDNAQGEFYSVALTNNYQQADTGTKMMHIGKNTRSRIVSKGISAGNSKNTYRGFVNINKKAIGARNYSQCDSLLIGNDSNSNTFPFISVQNCTTKVEHEASTSKIGEEQIFYFLQRGISIEKGIELMISGFCREVFTELPLEFASEADRLLSLKLEGSVG